MADFIRSVFSHSSETLNNVLVCMGVHRIPHLVIIENFLTSIYSKYIQNESPFALFGAAVILYYLWSLFTKSFRYIYGYGLIGAISLAYNAISRYIFSIVLASPLARGKVEKEVQKTISGMETEMMVKGNLNDYTELPVKAWTDNHIIKELEELSNLKHSDWKNGRVSGAVYHGGDNLINLQSEAFKMFCVANQLHPDVFPGVRKMESEIVSMVLKLYNAPDSACGTSTSGGTESLLLTCLAARTRGEKLKGIKSPEMIVPSTVHAAFNKAAYYFKIKAHYVPVDLITGKVDLYTVKRLINNNTILLAGSAPNFPHGIIDDIQGLGKLALKYDIPLHVDCCLGSFIVPFLNKAGFDDVPIFDFRVPGVTSISCDTHKYGFAPKGSSIIMYRDQKLRACQYFITTDWSGGLYGSPTLAGSRPGALMVGCWATLMSIGHDRYLKYCKEIVGAARYFKESIINEIPELQVIGDPLSSVVSFTSTSINVYHLSDAMTKKGWHLSALQTPPALHVAFTYLTVPVVDELISTLKSSVKSLANEGPVKSDTAALYGVAGSVSTAGVVDKLIEGFIDTMYKV